MIRNWIVLFIIMIFWGCKSNLSTASRNPEATSTKLYLGAKEFISFPDAGNETYAMKTEDLGSLQRCLLLGKLAAPSHLETNSGKITLTQIGMQAATAIEMGFFQFPAKQFGKYALIRGNWDEGNMVYQAEIVCILDRGFDRQMQDDLASGKVKLGDICTSYE